MQQNLARLAAHTKSGRHPAETIRRLDRELAALHLGVELHLSDRPFYRGRWVLGYGKVAEADWCLLVRDAEQQGAPLPLAQAPREVQIAALALAPKLLAELGKQVEVAVRGMEWARVIPKALPRLANERQRRRRRP